MGELLDTLRLLFFSGKSLRALLTVLAAITVSGLLFVGVNLALNLARRKWAAFAAVAGLIAGGALFGLMAGNRLLHDLPGDPWSWLLVGAVVGAAGSFAVAAIEGHQPRLIASTAIAAGIGALLGVLLNDATQPGLDWALLALWLAIGAAAGAAVGALYYRRRRSIERGALVGAGIGVLFGGWGGADLGGGSAMEGVLLMAAGGALLGLAVGWVPRRSVPDLRDLAERLRTISFVGPALFFIIAGLVIPLFRTLVVSFRNAKNDDWIGLRNYKTIFTDKKSVNFSNWEHIFTARLFWVALVIVAVGVLYGLIGGKRTGRSFEYGGSSLGPLIFGLFLLSCAVLANIRGTIFNNLWWVIVVTFVTTAMGLAVAVLADKAKFERAAKALVFLPMAISFVGAGIIWRFMYQTRNTTKEQTGLLNAIWVGLGRFTTDDVGQWVSLGVLLFFGLGFLALAAWSYRHQAGGMLAGSVTLLVPVVYLAYRVLGDGYGGLPGDQDQDRAIEFINQSPWNNIWLMVILIWIQTGFAMVIFSAAIRSVPTELVEAARVDGATESQAFWRVIIPQILPTIGVVTTTLILTVMKVFDIVSVTTNGNFDTQVIANDMWQRSFRENNRGLGSALAMVLFVAVIPVMVYNIRRMQAEREEA